MSMKPAILSMKTSIESVNMEDLHEQSGADLLAGGLPGHSSDSGLGTNQTDDFDDFLGDFDTDDYGSTEECVLVGFLGIEDDTGFPQSVADALGYAAAHHVSKSKAGKTGLARRTAITEEDFEEGAPRNAFMIIRAQAENLFSKDPRVQKRRPEAIDYFFTNLDNGEDVTFQLCCDVLDTRADVLRLRIVYEFWLRGVQFTNPMPFETVQIPEVVVNEVYMLCGDVGLAVAHSVWNWPGVGIQTVLNRCHHLGYSDKVIETTIARLQDEFILSEIMDGWYLTGRNPIMQSMRDQTKFGGKSVPMMTQTTHWSRLF